MSNRRRSPAKAAAALRYGVAVLLWHGFLFAGQYRAFWADAFHYGYKTPAEIDRMVDDVAQARANAIFMEVRTRAASRSTPGSQ